MAELDILLSDPESLGNLKKSVRENPGKADVHYKLALALLENSDYRQAQAWFQKTLALDKKNQSGLIPTALFYLALCQASEDQSGQSLATIDRLMKDYPQGEKNPEALLLSGEILASIGKKEEAKARITEFLKKYPDHRLAPAAQELLAK
jgi:TolA-binding protein